MQNCNTVVRLAMVAWFLMATSPQLWAAPGFDLDLKELKKPSAPPPAATKKAVKPAAKTRHHASAKKQNRTTGRKNSPVQKQAETTVAALSVAPSELVLKGGDACQLAERMAVAVARSVPAESVLNGLELKPVVAVKSGDLTMLITCSLSPAEAYTFARLLETRQIYLLNIGEHETTAQVAQGIIDTLALSYIRENDTASPPGELSYLFPADQERQRPLKLTLLP